MRKGHWYSKIYVPLQVGSIDGTDIKPHDHAISRAQNAIYALPKSVEGDPYTTIFVARLNLDTNEETLNSVFSQYGSIKSLRLVRNFVTGDSRGYAFIEYLDKRSAENAYQNANNMLVDSKPILVDYERSRIMDGWIPRRLGGGLGGRKESGQLRFGGRDRPFKMPLKVGDNHEIPRIESDQIYSDCWRRRRDNDRLESYTDIRTSTARGQRQVLHNYSSRSREKSPDNYDQPRENMNSSDHWRRERNNEKRRNKYSSRSRSRERDRGRGRRRDREMSRERGRERSREGSRAKRRYKLESRDDNVSSSHRGYDKNKTRRRSQSRH
ncbi:uncharacterized protein VTP21DRAFT_2671 [Calcarisporiella thermophila]|uniref:uncharacterized protein n=1 Tax=Calcarisporiella thermophila TaxID=911321 RepID=UPI003743791F